MEDLSDTNIIKLINECNNKNDNDKIKHWLTEIVIFLKVLIPMESPVVLASTVDNKLIRFIHS